MHCKIIKTFLIRGLQPALNDNVGSEKLFLLARFCFVLQISNAILSVNNYFTFLIRYQSFTLHLNLFVI